MTSYKICVPTLTPQPLYRDGYEILPNPARTYMLTHLGNQEFRVSCVEDPHCLIAWTLYHNNDKVYCKREDMFMWHRCEIKVHSMAVPKPAVTKLQPRVSKASRAFHKVQVKFDGVLAFLRM